MKTFVRNVRAIYSAPAREMAAAELDHFEDLMIGCYTGLVVALL